MIQVNGVSMMYILGLGASLAHKKTKKYLKKQDFSLIGFASYPEEMLSPLSVFG